MKRRGTCSSVTHVGALIAFDLDGVLYTSEPFLGDAYREAIARVNARRPGSVPRVPKTREILDHVGWPLPTILARLFPGIDAPAVELLYSETQQVICARVARREGILFPGVVETLVRLQRAGHCLAVASNGQLPYVETVLATYDIARYFMALVSVDGGGSVRSKADILRAYLRRERRSPQQLIMVGDRASDVEAAQAVGCRFVGCDYGHGNRDEIEGRGPVVPSFDALPPVVVAILSNCTAAG
ncbi:MAG TPA: HAD family hydrolase [Candidatus Margulisiibacteriota bacterium]|nr:HAD family hydrolase [Candidatus Margulisiibacteriota bacterium]